LINAISKPLVKMTKQLIWWTLIAVGCAIGIALIVWLIAQTDPEGNVREHRFTLDQIPLFLTDEMALEKAQSAMSLEGFEPPVWRPIEDRRTVSPEGNADYYLVRNQVNPNEGFIQFQNAQRSSNRIVSIELHTNSINCKIIVPK
jgi:hypothetical protein